MPIVKAAAVQISPVLYSREGTVGKVVKKILELGRQGVQFATFPETVIPYYPYFSFVEALPDGRGALQVARSGGDRAV
jgi:nitrilase